MATVAVLGGGVSGLSAAYYVAKFSSRDICKKILLLESSNRLGGWVQTSQHDDGTVFEKGPRSIRGTGIAGENTVQLVDELGLGNDILPVKPSHPAAKNRFIFVDGQLHKLPNGIMPIFRHQSPFSRSLVAMCWKEPFRSRSTLDDETIYSFVSRRLGEEVAKYAIDPLCRGIFAGDARQLSMRSCFPPLWRFEKNHGSLIRGAFLTKRPERDEEPRELLKKFKQEKWSMWSLKGGLEQFTDSLAAAVQRDDRVELLMDTSCTALHFKDGKAQVVCGENNWEVDQVMCSLPAPSLSHILSGDHQQFVENLQKIPSVSVAVVNLQYEGNVLPVQCMMGGAWFRELFGEEGNTSSDDFAEIAKEAVREQMGVRDEPFRVNVSLQKNCIPQYLVGHWRLLDNVHSYIQDNMLPLNLIGSSYEGVSINDCILNARRYAKELVSTWKS